VLLEGVGERQLLAACRRQLELGRFVPDLQHEKSLERFQNVLEFARDAGHAMIADSIA